MTKTASGRFCKTSLGFMLLKILVKFIIALLPLMLYTLYNVYIFIQSMLLSINIA